MRNHYTGDLRPAEWQSNICMFPLLILFLESNPGGTVRQKTVTAPGMIGAILFVVSGGDLGLRLRSGLALLGGPNRTRTGWLFIWLLHHHFLESDLGVFPCPCTSRGNQEQSRSHGLEGADKTRCRPAGLLSHHVSFQPRAGLLLMSLPNAFLALGGWRGQWKSDLTWELFCRINKWLTIF